MRWIAVALLLFCGLTVLMFFRMGSIAQVQISPSKKLIYYGWGIRDTMFVREHWREMEKMPFDGTGIAAAIDRKRWQEGKTDTGNQLGWNLFGLKTLRLEDFGPAIVDLKATQWHRFTDNFLPACISSSGQDFGFNWFDDTRWKTILNNWRILVTIAKEGGCKGILLDPEHYGAYFFHYPTMRQRVDKPFTEYAMRARQRGQQLMEMMRQVFPDITVLMFFAHSYLALHPTERKKPPEENAYGLLPAFVDGMMKGADERAQFVDLCEFAYGYKRKEQFLEAYHGIVNKAMPFSLLPEMYRRRIRVGFGLWLDYGNAGAMRGKRWDVRDFSRNYFSPDEFRQSLQWALEVSDGYVWIYSQQPRFFPPSDLPDAYLRAVKEARQTAGLD